MSRMSGTGFLSSNSVRLQRSRSKQALIRVLFPSESFFWSQCEWLLKVQSVGARVMSFLSNHSFNGPTDYRKIAICNFILTTINIIGGSRVQVNDTLGYTALCTTCNFCISFDIWLYIFQKKIAFASPFWLDRLISFFCQSWGYVQHWFFSTVYIRKTDRERLPIVNPNLEKTSIPKRTWISSARFKISNACCVTIVPQ